MTFEKAFIIKKLELVAEHTQELSELLKAKDNEQLRSDSGSLHIAERLVQLIVDTMIDINQHFIRELDLQVPDDLRGTFTIMGDKEILPKEFADKITSLAGLRNILVHQYEDLDKDLFVRKLRENFSDFEQYQKYVYGVLEKMPGDGSK